MLVRMNEMLAGEPQAGKREDGTPPLTRVMGVGRQQPMPKNYTCLRGSHHLTSEKMYVLEWKRRNTAFSLHGQVPPERRLGG